MNIALEQTVDAGNNGRPPSALILILLTSSLHICSRDPLGCLFLVYRNSSLNIVLYMPPHVISLSQRTVRSAFFFPAHECQRKPEIGFEHEGLFEAQTKWPRTPSTRSCDTAHRRRRSDYLHTSITITSDFLSLIYLDKFLLSSSRIKSIRRVAPFSKDSSISFVVLASAWT